MLLAGGPGGEADESPSCKRARPEEKLRVESSDAGPAALHRDAARPTRATVWYGRSSIAREQTARPQVDSRKRGTRPEAHGRVAVTGQVQVLCLSKREGDDGDDRGWS